MTIVSCAQAGLGCFPSPHAPARHRPPRQLLRFVSGRGQRNYSRGVSCRGRRGRTYTGDARIERLPLRAPPGVPGRSRFTSMLPPSVRVRVQKFEGLSRARCRASAFSAARRRTISAASSPPGFQQGSCAFDTVSYIPLGNAVLLSGDFLLALLNSKLIDWYFGSAARTPRSTSTSSTICRVPYLPTGRKPMTP